MAISILMYKISGDDKIVFYKFVTNEAEGYCEFNIETEKFILNKKQTDPYYFEKPYYEGVNYMAFKVWTRLILQKRAGEFPDLIHIAC